jgi:small-conductance mechanosensitive channel
MTSGIIISTSYVNVDNRNINHKLLAYVAIIVFVFAGIIFLRLSTSSINKIIASRRLGIGRAAAMQFILRVIGYLVIFLSALELMDISIAKLLLGGAIIGIILGVAAQQALANFFASVILILTHPFRVGEEVTIISGSFGGANEGTVMDIGLTHTKLKLTNGKIMFMPNSTILTWAAIVPHQQSKKH